MKKVIITIAITLSFLTGFATVNAAENNISNTTVSSNADNRVYVKVFEDGAIWVYVYEQDGSFVAKYIEQN